MSENPVVRTVSNDADAEAAWNKPHPQAGEDESSPTNTTTSLASEEEEPERSASSVAAAAHTPEPSTPAAATTPGASSTTTPGAATATTAVPLLLNRWNNWKSNPKAAAVVSLFRPKTESGSNNNSTTRGGMASSAPWKNLSSSFQPLQTATLSPAAKSNNNNNSSSSIHPVDDDHAPKSGDNSSSNNNEEPVRPSSPPSPIRRIQSDPVSRPEELAETVTTTTSNNNSNNKKQQDSSSSEEEECHDFDYESSIVSGSLFSDTTDDDDDRHTNSTTSSVSALQWAAASVVDSVQQSSGYFRGRYQQQQQQQLAVVNRTPHPPRKTTATPTPHKSQTARILASPQAAHLQRLQESLHPAEYIMLLGRGMLGVNLKQTYKKKEGVYVDYLVAQGAADRSGVVYVGDVVHAVGADTTARRHGTIWTVPQQIAAAKRPVHIVLSTPRPDTGTGPNDTTNESADDTNHGPLLLSRISHVDVAVALLHQVVGHDDKFRTSNSSSRASQGPPRGDDDPSADNDDDDDHHQPPHDRRQDSGVLDCSNEEERKGEIELVTPTSFDDDDMMGDAFDNNSNQNNNESNRPVVMIDIQLQDSVQSFINPGMPLLAVRQALQMQVAKRNNAWQFHHHYNHLSLQLLLDKLVYTTHTNFRHAARNAFLYSVMDGRRFPFLARHFALLDASMTTTTSTTSDLPRRPRRQVGSENGPDHDIRMDHDDDWDQQQQQQLPPEVLLSSSSSLQSTTAAASSSSTAMLMLFLEMMNFTDLYGVTPPKRRYEIAHRIAHKYFLPTAIGTNTNTTSSSSTTSPNTNQQHKKKTTHKQPAVEKQQLVPPMFDFHQLVSDASLRQLEAALSLPNTGSSSIPQDVFWDFQQAVADTLAGRPFCAFLLSNECARMRAYLRNTAPFRNVPLPTIFDSLVSSSSTTTTTTVVLSNQETAAAKNYFFYILTYLFCLTDKEGFGEHDDILGENPTKGSRIEDAASGLCAALFLRTRVLPALQTCAQQGESTTTTAGSMKELMSVMEQLWESFVAPGVGALSHRSQCGDVDEHLRTLTQALQDVQKAAANGNDEWIKLLCHNDNLVTIVQALADELLYEYASNLHSKFRAHKFHEWVCDEFARVKENLIDTGFSPTTIPQLPPDCIKRLLRKVEWPSGIAPHKPSHEVLLSATPSSSSSEDDALPDESNSNLETLTRSNAECAIVFGTAVGLDLASQMPIPGMEDNSLIRRFCCVSTHLEDDDANSNLLSPMEIPSTLESYAIPPASRPKPFEGYTRGTDGGLAGWEASLVNFVVPRADVSSEGGEESSLYGVSLVFRQSKKENLLKPTTPSILLGSEPHSSDQEDSAAQRKIKASISSPAFSKRLADRTWTERLETEVCDENVPAVIGLALVSQRNVILAMRETLLLLFGEFAKSTDKGIPTIVDLLGNFAHWDVESEILLSILDPFLRASSAPWLERPIAAQKRAFEQAAGGQLIQSVPPIPLALLFVTALLEQKIVLSSSRRSLLLSATVALSALLKPLKWCHLLVPCVPASLAADLLQYPAPFILGMPSEDPGIMNIIRELPESVTLVDLDVGRVILAPSFAHDSELGRGTPNNAETSQALRSQVLYLAQSLGNVFGRTLERELWQCDGAHISLSHQKQLEPRNEHPYDALQSVARDFVQELLAGTTSCCYWMEEARVVEDSVSTAAKSEPTILFDEDRFFHVKNSRERDGFEPLFGRTKQSNARALALSLDNFDLVLELLLRCQSMNDYIGNRKRKDMAFSL